jgi:sugar (glycoside-pentoside-hexuronide) transporter
MEKQVFETARKERFSYGIYFLGQLISYSIVTSFLQLYLTDIGVAAASVALIFLIAKIWDAVNDPLFGAIVNRVTFKKGKYTPWLRSSAFIIPLCTVFLFGIPTGASAGLKFALALISYIGWDMSYTLCDVPAFSVVTAMTNNIRERTSIITYGRVLMFIGGIIVSLAVPVLYPVIGWFPTVAMLSIITLLTMVPLGYVAQERHRPAAEAESPSVKELLLGVVQNKYLLLIIIGSVIAIITATGGTVTGYFAIYCLGAPQYMSILNILYLIPLMLITPFVPALIKRIDKFTLLMIAHGGAIIMSCLVFLAGYANLPLFFTLSTIRSACMVLPPGILLPMFVLDCAEYGLYKTGKSTTALAVSLQTFTAKLPGAISGSLAMLLLSLSGFVSGAGAVQPQSAITTIWLLISLVPVIGMIAAFIILLLGYKLRDRDIQIMARVNQGDLSREEAEKLLSPGIAR